MKSRPTIGSKSFTHNNCWASSIGQRSFIEALNDNNNNNNNSDPCIGVFVIRYAGVLKVCASKLKPMKRQNQRTRSVSHRFMTGSKWPHDLPGI